MKKAGWILLLLLHVKLYAQVLPGDLMYRDSFPGVKSCLVRRMSFDPRDSVRNEKYEYQRYTYLPDGRKTGSFDFHRCGKDFYTDSTFDSIVYNRDGLIVKKIEYSNFFGDRENRTEVYSYDKHKRVKQVTEKYDLRDRPHTTTFYYDRKGRVVMMTDTTKHDTVQGRFFYNHRMRVAIFEAKRSFGVIDTTWYNENGDVTKKCVYLTATQDGVTDQRCWDSIIYQYDGRVPVRKDEYRYGDLDHIIYEYDKEGRIIKVTTEQPGLMDDQGMVSRMVYDEHGNMIERRTTAPIDYEEVDLWKITYNERGLPIHAEHSRLYSNVVQYNQVYDYTYTYY